MKKAIYIIKKNEPSGEEYKRTSNRERADEIAEIIKRQYGYKNNEIAIESYLEE